MEENTGPSQQSMTISLDWPGQTPYFPKDELTDKSMRFFITEIIGLARADSDQGRPGSLLLGPQEPTVKMVIGDQPMTFMGHWH